ncbi:LysR family transcriptional regulator [Acidobacteria bacterium AB60]|nr:LysR family transcriptional regulator [Acidobacteria bacterium AB60]
MELRHLRYFIAAAEELNITKAAARLRVSQPPLSRQIRDLEEEVGAALFDRSQKKLRLTLAGKYFLEEAKTIVSQSDRAAKIAKATAMGQAGQIRIAFLSPLGGLFLPQAIRAFRRKFPMVEVDLVEMVPRRQLEALLDHEVDLAFVANVEVEGRSEFAFETVMDVELRLALPPDHRLAKLRRVPFSKLAGEPFITVTRSAAPATHALFLSVCRSFGVEPYVAKQAERAQSILDLVAAGVGVAILPAHIKRYQANVIWRRVTPDLPRVPLCMVWRKNDVGGALETLRGAILRHFKNLS